MFAAFLLLLSLVLARATYLNTAKAGEFKALAGQQQSEEITVFAQRGSLTDRHGAELAVSEEAITVYANPKQIEDPAGAAAKLAPILRSDSQDLYSMLGDRRKGFLYLARKLDPRRAAAVKRLDIAGVGLTPEPKRIYPQKSVASQTVGSVGLDNAGLTGLEYAFERTLHGVDGKERVVKNALGKPVSMVTTSEESAGEPVRLTLDAALQERVESVLGRVGDETDPIGATGIVMEPKTGDLLALASWPSYDAGRPDRAVPEALRNRPVSDLYEPGSTMKAMTMGAALEEDVMQPNETMAVGDQIQVADRVIENSAGAGESGLLTPGQILGASSNVGAIMTALRLGKERFARWVERFGFHRPIGLGFPGESDPLVPDVSEYSGSSIANLPMGQGLAVTPLHMVQAYGAIANGGTLRKPRLVLSAGDRSMPVDPGRRILSSGTARSLRKMLQNAVGPYGTASRAAIDGYEIAGKTGTANKADGAGGYSEMRNVVSFVAMVPADDPELLAMVTVDEPKSNIAGGLLAAPAVKEIFDFALPYMRIAPTA